MQHVAARSSGKEIDRTLPITIHFHPGRKFGGRWILDSLKNGGVYLSQFQTGTSNGGLTAYPGGDRWSWESRIFGNAYDDAPASERPTYGSLNYKRLSEGGSPRFGSAHFRLKPAVLDRATFCYPDSVFNPEHFGVASKASDLIELAVTNSKDRLDDYIEAQVHGTLIIEEDAEALVLDPCFAGTEIEKLAKELPCPVEWHRGFRLHVDELKRHPEYRGEEYVELGVCLARNGYLDAKLIDDAALTGIHDEQNLKRVWHYIARYGSAER